MPKPLKFHQRLDRYPPVLIRLLAINWRGRGSTEMLTDREISAHSNLSIAWVKRLNYSTSWKDIPIDVAQLFLTGCGIDLENRRTLKRLEYMRRRGGFSHVRKSALFDTQFREMVDVWEESKAAAA